MVLPVTPNVPPTVAPLVTAAQPGRRTTAQDALEGGVACHSQRATDSGVAGGRQRGGADVSSVGNARVVVLPNYQRAGHRSASQGRRTTAQGALEGGVTCPPNVPPTVAPLVTATLARSPHHCSRCP